MGCPKAMWGHVAVTPTPAHGSLRPHLLLLAGCQFGLPLVGLFAAVGLGHWLALATVLQAMLAIIALGISANQ